MTKEEKEKQKSAAVMLTTIAEDIILYSKKGIPVKLIISAINTGLAEGPNDSSGWKTVYSLGGKIFSY
jgi:hypothetical protein